MRFSIRDLLWLTLLAAVLIAWWLDRSRLAQYLDDLRIISSDDPSEYEPGIHKLVSPASEATLRELRKADATRLLP